MVEFDQLKIRGYRNWELFLHPNQCYLGRTYLAAKRDGDLDLSDATWDELREFSLISKKLKQTLDKLWQPDKLNFTQLGNEWEHLHIHVIPRYRTPRVFVGIEFKDDRWGKNPAPYNKDFKVDDSVLFSIRDAIKRKL